MTVAKAGVPADALDPELALPNRALTSGEVALLRPLFEDSIDYTRVRVIDNSFPLQPENVYMTPRGHIYAPGPLFQADFSAARSSLREVFVHEMTHVWQYENGMDLVGAASVEFIKNRGSYEKAYPYELVAGRDLTEYGMEQQASIVEDYFALTALRGSAHRMTNKGLSPAERDALYAAVLKNFLANARYARGLDANTVAAQHARDSEKKQPGPEACKESEQEHGATHLCSWRFTPIR
ncbi:MAG: hypothetical protein JNL83_38330 [Myxococcales bacterium]|nr:hypothetical protein [Myxococcales bacterium]